MDNEEQQGAWDLHYDSDGGQKHWRLSVGDGLFAQYRFDWSGWYTEGSIDLPMEARDQLIELLRRDPSVSPPAPDAGLRERAAKAAYDSQKRWRLAEFKEVPFSDAAELTRRGYLEVADSVLAAIREPQP